MNPESDANMLDTVLTLRGHRVTLRQAMAEGLIRDHLNSRAHRVRIDEFDANRVLERPDTWRST